MCSYVFRAMDCENSLPKRLRDSVWIFRVCHELSIEGEEGRKEQRKEEREEEREEGTAYVHDVSMKHSRTDHSSRYASCFESSFQKTFS